MSEKPEAPSGVQAFYMARDREAAERAQTMQADMDADALAGNPSSGE